MTEERAEVIDFAEARRAREQASARLRHPAGGQIASVTATGGADITVTVGGKPACEVCHDNRSEIRTDHTTQEHLDMLDNLGP